MAIIKNTAAQGLYVYAHDTAADAAKTGDAANITATISLDGAAAGATNDTNPTEIGGGVYWFALTQAETNAGALALVPVSATGDVVLDPIIVLTQEAVITYQSGDAHAIVNHVDYGNAKLVRSTTPANTLTVDASHQALADVNAVSGDSTAADRLEAILDATPGGAVVDDNDPDPTATAFETNLTEATNDHYNGAFVVFTSGALLGQSRKISDYDGTSKVLTVAAAFTEAPTAGDTFLILGRSE